MNQRFQNEEIRLISEQNADNELYKAICTIGTQLEAESPGFGLNSEECFIESLELLSAIADEGENILPKIEELWLRKENEYRRFDRNVNNEEIRKAVGIVFGYVILAIDSCSHPFYRYTLSERLMQIITNHKFEGWTSTLDKIFSVPLSDGWFDAYIEGEKQEDSDDVSENKLENKILKKNHNGKPLDFQKLHKTIETAFVAEIKFGYEWLALWRILYDLRLLENITLTAFAEQMNKWYPNAKKHCNADNMGDYYNPYLGVTALAQWEEDEFKSQKTSKQSITGYRLLCNDCEIIKEALNSFFYSGIVP